MTVVAYRKAEHANFGVAMCLILLALYLIYTKSRKEIGQYRKLLVIFLLSGVFFALLHVILSPTTILRENAFITYSGSGWVTDMRFIAVYYGVVSISFIILAMQFLYRAMVLSRKTTAVVEVSRKNIAQIIIIIIVQLVVWVILCLVLSYRTEYQPTIARLTADLEDFPENDHDNRLLMFLGTIDNELNIPPFLAIVAMLLICGCSLTMIIWSTIRIVRVLNDEQHQSSRWKKYNYQLFVALYLQFLGPLFLLYIPCITYLLLPFVPGHGVSSPPWMMSLFYSIYPIVDPLVMILFIRDYRRGLINILRKAVFMNALDESTVVAVGNQRSAERNSNK